MDALIIDNNQNVLDLYSVLLERNFQITSAEASNLRDALELLNADQEKRCRLIVCGIPQRDNVQDLLDYLDKKQFKLPILFTSDDNHLSLVADMVPYHAFCGRISYNKDEAIISSSIARLLRVGKRYEKRQEEQNKDFCRISSKFFKDQHMTNYDIFVKLSKEKYLKLFHRNTQISKKDVEKYVTNGHLYLRASDYLDATNKIFNRISKVLEIKELTVSKLCSVSLFAHNSVNQTIGKLGLKTEVLENANLALNSAFKAAKTNASIYKLLRKVMSQENYLSCHSLMIVFVSNAIAKETKYYSDETIEKLTVASIFHDIVLKDSETVQLMDSNHNNYAMFNHIELNNYRNHPQEVAEMLEKVEGIPYESMKIIKQHHELPNGNGFPRGTDFKQINILSAIFIVSEEFVNSIYNSGLEQINVNDIIEDLEKKFDKGNFKIAIEGLKKVFFIPLETDDNKQQIENK